MLPQQGGIARLSDTSAGMLVKFASHSEPIKILVACATIFATKEIQE